MLREMEKQQILMGEVLDQESQDRAVKKYGQLEDRFSALGGYEAESEAARITSSLGLEDRILGQPLSTLSGGQRRRVELARILFAASDGSGARSTRLCFSTSPPTTSTPTPSPGCVDSSRTTRVDWWSSVTTSTCSTTSSTVCGSSMPSAVRPTSTT
ncbi:hypothetical protein GCM10020255_080890 [Rhodococcus baikonurensis]